MLNYSPSPSPQVPRAMSCGSYLAKNRRCKRDRAKLAAEIPRREVEVVDYRPRGPPCRICIPDIAEARGRSRAMSRLLRDWKAADNEARVRSPSVGAARIRRCTERRVRPSCRNRLKGEHVMSAAPGSSSARSRTTRRCGCRVGKARAVRASISACLELALAAYVTRRHNGAHSTSLASDDVKRFRRSSPRISKIPRASPPSALATYDEREIREAGRTLPDACGCGRGAAARRGSSAPTVGACVWSWRHCRRAARPRSRGGRQRSRRLRKSRSRRRAITGSTF